ncbi:TAXI family TRAP transporter solute-binding subunit [Desulfallas sp. Bu1-1]|uniref:TAXI family TRAP transporter solute-binding subunit n=1 Tax=Desulfallas sp. Bu1-1 TaxID=2787620 RepID=UPI00189CD140|nr:TAXI family TRAP transporter solute-binding subunit [Desulfallas sp. Bu1-1]MBF7083665.1 TAXI family TRAP transporter solute-binding subunit [Desulfallas sp. Bu1-1]
MFKRKTCIPVIMMLLLIMALLAGCGGQGGESKNEGKSDNAKNSPMQAVHASGPIGSGWYPISVLITDIWMENMDGLNVSVIEGAGVSNLKAVDGGVDAVTGLTFSSDFADALAGRGAFEGNKLENVMALGTIYPTMWNIAVLESSPIKSVEDIVGKHLFPGEPGFSSEQATKRILEAYGITYDDIKAAGGKISFGGYSDGANMLKDGIVDVCVAGGAPNVVAFSEVDATKPIRLLPLPEDILKKIDEKGYGYNVSMKIPAGTYKNQKEDVPCLTTMGLIIVNKNLDDDYVYQLTKSLWENVDRIKKEQPARGKWMDAESAYKNIPDPSTIHPGALRYYKEIGVAK